MGLLLDRWHLAQQGEGQAIVLTAEAGMGKSRLVEALFERIGAEPHRRVVLQCSPYHSNTAFYPAMRQIEHAAGFALEDSIAQKLDKLDAFLARTGSPAIPTAPLLADLLSLPSDGRYAAVDLTPAQRKSATISALVDHLMGLSASEPVLLVLEDAHWIDPTTQELLTRLIDSIEFGSCPRHRHGTAGIRIALGGAGSCCLARAEPARQDTMRRDCRRHCRSAIDDGGFGGRDPRQDRRCAACSWKN